MPGAPGAECQASTPASPSFSRHPRTHMSEELEEVVSSLLYEGYALYPYRPEATKNATPTPFGIVYPPVYAAECEGAHDHARLEALAVTDPAERGPARLTATLCWL